jgi:hypothetical protein
MPEKEGITVKLSCSQQTLDEARKGKLFLALSGRTSVLQGCQFERQVKFSRRRFRQYPGLWLKLATAITMSSVLPS